MNEIRFIAYWSSARRFNDEKLTVRRWDLWNKPLDKTKYAKKVEKGEMSSKDVAEHHHANGLMYDFCVFNEEHQKYPFAYITLSTGKPHIGVDFIDYSGRKYLTYLFSNSKEKNEKLFLGEVWYYEFSSEEVEEEDYRLHFVFDEEGDSAYRKYDEINKKAIDYTGNKKINIDELYEDMPKFGNYASILRLERLPVHDTAIREQIDKSLFLSEKNDSIYKTFKGKNYTKEEWEAYEKEQWDKYNGKN